MKTNRDKFAILYAIIWLLCNLLTYIFTKDKGWVIISTYSFMLVMAIIVFLSKRNVKFSNWLDK